MLPGLIVDGPIIRDEQIHRVGTLHKPRSKNGWYVAYADGTIIYGNWEEGDGHNVIKGDGAIEANALDRSRVEKLKEQRAAEQEKIAHDAREIYENAERKGFSDYLKRKQIWPHGARFDGSTLLIPMQDAAGQIWSLQRIYSDGSKYFLQGGRTKGCYYLIANDNVEVDQRVVVCEGFATGASIHQATGLPVVVAFNASNLKPVADSLVFRNIIIAADNDASTVGEQAAINSGYPYVMPPNVGEDFSDMFLRCPLEVKSFFIDDIIDPQDKIIKAHGLVGEIADWITATAIRPQPLLSLAASLAFVGMLKGHRVRGYTDLRTNLLILAMAPTAGGKEHPQNCLKRLAKASGLQKNLMGEAVSGAGFLNSLKNAGNVGLMVMDEVGRYIGNLSSSSAGIHQREIIDYIIKTFSCANSILMGREKAAAAKEPRIDVDQPHFCCYGSTVYEKFRDACGSGDIVDGFLNRWLMFHSEERPERQQKVKFGEPPASIIDQIHTITATSPYDKYGNPQPRELRFTPEAWESFLAYRARSDEFVKNSPYPINQLHSRAPEHVEKVAHTLSDGEFTGVHDLEVAIAIVEQSNKSIMQFASMISDTVHEKDFVRVREIIKESGEIAHSALLRRSQFVAGGARRVNEMLSVMIEEGFVAPREGINKKKMYKWISRF